jgi:citrate synthase
MAGFLTADEAAARLGVTRATLYAYVSRGLIRAHEADDPHRRLYAADAVERLAIERRRGRRPKEVAKATLDFGAPVLESAITLIRDGRVWHRGVDAVVLAETAELEDVAALLWELPRSAAFGAAASSAAAPVAPAVDAESLLARFATSGASEATAAWVADPTRLAAGCGALVRRMAAAATGAAGGDAPIHVQCAVAWGLDRNGARRVRKALNLSADHELNASSFTVRCVASTGASLQAAVIAGLAALSGPRHGGMTERVESLFDAAEVDGATAALRRRLAAGEALPGFGHPLYPNGDPRAAALLAEAAGDPLATALADETEKLTGLRPSLDFGLVATRRALRLPRGAAFALFAVGRTVGWIAHALEQRKQATLIRPRAAYSGRAPDEAAFTAAAPA